MLSVCCIRANLFLPLKGLTESSNSKVPLLVAFLSVQEVNHLHLVVSLPYALPPVLGRAEGFHGLQVLSMFGSSGSRGQWASITVQQINGRASLPSGIISGSALYFAMHPRRDGCRYCFS